VEKKDAKREQLLKDAETYIVYIDQALNENDRRLPPVRRLRRPRGSRLGPAAGTKGS
jgi:hypothetical protein